MGKQITTMLLPVNMLSDINLQTGAKRKTFPGFYMDERSGILCENMVIRIISFF